jgi:hypothetical protein
VVREEMRLQVPESAAQELLVEQRALVAQCTRVDW